MNELECMYELVTSYNKNAEKAKLTLEMLKGKASKSTEERQAIEKFECIIIDLERINISLKQVQVLCELGEAKANGREEEALELEEMLKEF